MTEDGPEVTTDPATWPEWYLGAALRTIAERGLRWDDDQRLLFWSGIVADVPEADFLADVREMSEDEAMNG